MGDDKFEYHPYEAVPIPTYDQAIADSQPDSSRSPVEGNGAETHGLLRGHYPHRNRGDGEAGRSSLDSLASSERGSLEQLQGELNRMDVEEPPPQPSERSRLGDRFSKPFNSLTRTLSSFRLPIRRLLPSFHFSLDLERIQAHMRENGCIIVLRLLAVALVLVIIYVFFVSDLFSMPGRGSLGQTYPTASIENFIQSRINESRIAESLEKMTNVPHNFTHVAGTEGSFALAEWIQWEFKAAGLENIQMEEFEVYLNYPIPNGRRVAIVDPPYEASLKEDLELVPVFHGHSKSGNVTGRLIYANYGSLGDFALLADRGVPLNGSIVLVRYYGAETDRALKVKAAELAGAAGCIIYSDPADDGFVQGPPYPQGRYMPADGVQRGSVALSSWVMGDVLSPGFASTRQEKKRLKPQDSVALNKIPSLPISWRDAQQLLRVLKGHGSEVPAEWVGGMPDVDAWWTGDATSPSVNLMNLQDEVERQPIFNVVGQITGMEQPDKKIIVGNHRDSWCLGGVDPGSGTAVFLEVVRVFGELLSYGWRPLRTIEFASWDAEEYNMIGSTEHVEGDIDVLRANAYAYLNVDVGVSGTDFEAAGSPFFERIVLQTMGRVGDAAANDTLENIWEDKGKRLGGLGAGSDYVAFQNIAGTSSLDFGFTGAPYPYHSCYENWDWMVKFGDPDFRYHRMLGEFWGLLLFGLAANPVMPLDVEAYAKYAGDYVTDLEKYAKTRHVPLIEEPSADGVSMKALFDAVAQFRETAERVATFEKAWHDTVWNSGGFESNLMGIERLNYNDRLAGFETGLLDLAEGGGVS